MNPGTWFGSGASGRAIRHPAFAGVVWTLLVLYALAWPWEILQRLPWLPVPGATVVKGAGAALIGLALLYLLAGRGWARLRTGFEAPLALFLVACGQSVLHSPAPGLSVGQFLQYGLYAASFYAFAVLLRSAEWSAAVARALMASSAAVAVVALCCAAGWIHPAFVGPMEATGAYIDTETRTSEVMRVAATVPDFNQGVYPMLLALPVALTLFRPQRAGRAGAILGPVVIVLLLGGMLVSFSRSSIVLAACMLAGYGLWRARAWFARREARRWAGTTAWVSAAVAAAVAAGALLTHGPLREQLAARAQQGFVTRDASYEGRMYVFEVAFQELPRYALFGTGLGASDIVLEQAADPAQWEGITLHSVPLKLLLETGVAGFAAYLWLAAVMAAHLWRGLRAAPVDSLHHDTLLALAMGFVASFAVLAIQPFMTLSLYPLLAAMVVGPLLGRDAPGEAAASELAAVGPRAKVRGLAVGMAVLLLTVPANMVQFQQAVSRASVYADTLHRGWRAEAEGAWRRAARAYDDAYALMWPRSGPASPFTAHPYYGEAVRVPDFAYFAEYMRPGYEAMSAEAYALLGVGRAAYARRDYAQAAPAFRNLTVRHPEYAFAHFALAETLWARQDFVESLAHYGEVAAHAGVLGNWRFKDRILDAFEARLDALAQETGVHARQARLDLLRRVGRWEEAVEEARALTQGDDPAPHAWFHVGAAAEIDGDPGAALEHYERALSQAPGHAAVAQAAARLR